MTIDELGAKINAKVAGRLLTITWLNKRDGSQVAAAKVDGKLLATWKADLINPPVPDGVTPRGPKDYHSLQFFDAPAGSN